MSKVVGAKYIKNYKRCVYSYEDHYRTIFNKTDNFRKGFLDLLTHDDTIEMVNLHKQLNPEDYDKDIFNSII